MAIAELGPRQTSNFCKQYCDKVIFQQTNISTKQYFFWHKQYFLTKYCYCFSKSAEITMNRDYKFTWRKNIAGKMSFYRFIFLSKYCSSKLLVWRGPYTVCVCNSKKMMYFFVLDRVRQKMKLRNHIPFPKWRHK
jgi:hypothetical protein